MPDRNESDRRQAGGDESSCEVEELRRTVHRLQRSVDELSILNQLATTIGACGDSEQVIDRIVHRSRRSVSAEQVVISLIDDDTEDRLDTVARSLTRSGRAFHLTRALLGRMLHDPRPLLFDDPRSDPRLEGLRIESDLESLLCVPLMVKSRVTGILAACNKKDGGRFDRDDERLLAIIATQSAQVIENARLHEEEKALALVQQELELARRIQAGLLPHEAPPTEGFELAGRSLPARAVGGDYFDYFALRDGSIAICLGDVSGKGIPAALLMANLQATLRGQVASGRDPGECLREINRRLYRDTPADGFATLFLGRLVPGRDRVEYSLAGHPPPLLVAGTGRTSPPETGRRGGPALGLLEDFAYPSRDLRLDTGDLLLAFSDGVTEALDARGEMFGRESIDRVLAGAVGRPTEAVIEAVIEAVNDHAGGLPQRDDITLLAVRRTG